MRKKMITALYAIPAILLGHGGVDHSKATQAPKPAPVQKSKKIYQKINQDYVKTIKPIFQAKCFACHAQKPKEMPWYYSVPGAKQLIDYDMTEAKKHIDFRKDFPFFSHGTPTMDLKSLWETIAEGEMPPLRYRILHWNTALNDKEVKKVQKWVDESLLQLKTIK